MLHVHLTAAVTHFSLVVDTLSDLCILLHDSSSGSRHLQEQRGRADPWGLRGVLSSPGPLSLGREQPLSLPTAPREQDSPVGTPCGGGALTLRAAP